VTSPFIKDSYWQGFTLTYGISWLYSFLSCSSRDSESKGADLWTQMPNQDALGEPLS
jgi:hypothetical protein